MADANAAPPQENDAQGTAAVYYVTGSPPPNEVSADLTNRREKGPWRKVWRERFGWMQSNQINNINNNNSGGGSDGGTAAPSTASPGPTNRRGRRNSVGPVTCQVPACGKTLDGTTPKYFSKHRVCEEHGKASQVDGFADGVSRRFCQQCSRFHELEKFEGDKRSCAESLRIHGERRVERYKKRKVEKMEEAARKAPMTSAGATPARPGTWSGLTLPSFSRLFGSGRHSGGPKMERSNSITSAERNVAPDVPTVSPHEMPPSERNVVPDVPTVSPHEMPPPYTAALPAPSPPPPPPPAADLASTGPFQQMMRMLSRLSSGSSSRGNSSSGRSNPWNVSGRAIAGEEEPSPPTATLLPAGATPLPVPPLDDTMRLDSAPLVGFNSARAIDEILEENVGGDDKVKIEE